MEDYEMTAQREGTEEYGANNVDGINSASFSESSDYASPLTVIVAQCYHDSGNYVVVPKCPFCYARHRHHLRKMEITATLFANGEVVSSAEPLSVKLSGCLLSPRHYALALYPLNQLTLQGRSKCQGVNKRGEPCRSYPRQGYPVCTRHLTQLEGVVQQQLAKLTL